MKLERYGATLVLVPENADDVVLLNTDFKLRNKGDKLPFIYVPGLTHEEAVAFCRRMMESPDYHKFAQEYEASPMNEAVWPFAFAMSDQDRLNSKEIRRRLIKYATLRRIAKLYPGVR